jgi:hypothetical protein
MKLVHSNQEPAIKLRQVFSCTVRCVLSNMMRQRTDAIVPEHGCLDAIEDDVEASAGSNKKHRLGSGWERPDNK